MMKPFLSLYSFYLAILVSVTATAAGESTLTLSEQDRFKAQVEECWSSPPEQNTMEGKDLRVRLRVTLDKEGSVMKIQIHDPEGRYRSDEDFRAVADSAMHALRECSPYITLPPEKYAAWRQTEIDFDPSGFFIPAKQ